MMLATLLLGVGLLLIVAEVLFPSFGVLGTLAAVSIVAASAVAFQESNVLGMRFVIATAILVPVGIIGGLKLLPYSPVTRKLVASGFSFEDGKGTDERNPELVGAEGVVTSQLRPAGMARLQGRRVDVVSRGELIESGTRVRVIAVEGNRVIVGRAPESESSETSS